MLELVVVPFPSCPFELPPQHFTAPVDVRAHECEPPDETADTPLVNPVTFTGVLRFDNVPSPSWPPELSPQHFTPPLVVSAHECEFPDDTAATPLVSPVTSTGVDG